VGEGGGSIQSGVAASSRLGAPRSQRLLETIKAKLWSRRHSCAATRCGVAAPAVVRRALPHVAALARHG